MRCGLAVGNVLLGVDFYILVSTTPDKFLSTLVILSEDLVVALNYFSSNMPSMLSGMLPSMIIIE